VLKSIEASPEEIAKHDCVIILTDHSAYDFRKIVGAAKLVVDTRNSTKDLHEFKDRVIKLGAGNKVPTEAHHDDGHATAPEATAH
jgi:UDP-N-acetyl-D-glucosamine dehydrogenase